METSSIIAKLDPPRNIFASLLPGRVNGPVHQLNLQRTVDRFGQGIVIAYSGPPYRLPYPELFQRPGEPGRRVVLPRSEWNIAPSGRSMLRAAISIASMISGVL